MHFLPVTEPGEEVVNLQPKTLTAECVQVRESYQIVMRDVLAKLSLRLYNLSSQFLLDAWVFRKDPHHCSNSVGCSVGSGKNEGPIQYS